MLDDKKVDYGIVHLDKGTPFSPLSEIQCLRGKEFTMQLEKYRAFVKKRPWFPRAVRSMIDWQIHGPGEKNPDRATELYFSANVNHLGVIPHSKCDLGKPGMEADTQHIESILLPTRVKVGMIRIHRVVYHDEGQPCFSHDHSMLHSTCSIQDAIDTYGRIDGLNRHIDALIELLYIHYGDVGTHRFNVMEFPASA